MTLKSKQKDLLFRILAEKTEDSSYLDGIGSESFPERKIDQICNWINDEFMMNGLAGNDEPNEYGLELEDLLDAVNRGRMT